MDKRIKILMVVLFSILLISANFSLFSGEKEFSKCPACGHKMEKGKGLAIDHHGKTIHVCGEKCKEAFEKKAADCTCGVTYKCPMNSCNYTSDKDGKCPKCGMALKKAEAKPVYKCTSEGCKFTSDKEGKCPACKTELKKVECEKCSGHKKLHKKHSKLHKSHKEKDCRKK
ncbi:MAG: heavy metal-binding domain-containing protein [Acidobacteriota bacterium]